METTDSLVSWVQRAEREPVVAVPVVTVLFRTILPSSILEEAHPDPHAKVERIKSTREEKKGAPRKMTDLKIGIISITVTTAITMKHTRARTAGISGQMWISRRISLKQVKDRMTRISREYTLVR